MKTKETPQEKEEHAKTEMHGSQEAEPNEVQCSSEYLCLSFVGFLNLAHCAVT